MLKITVKVDMQKYLDKMNAARDQIPFATALALTRTAQAVKADLVSGMSSAFKSPTTYTLNSLYLDRATKANLVATIGVKGADSGTGAVKWLKPEIMGGARERGLELFLEPLGLPPAGLYAVPGSKAKTTSGGKIDTAWVKRLVADIGAQGKSGGLINKRWRGIRKRDGALKYFVLETKWGKLLPGIYGKQGRSLLPFIIFVRQPRYAKRFDFYGIAQRTAQQRFPAEFAAAVKQAMATRR